MSAAKAFALTWDVPFIGVNHHEAHLYAALLEDPTLEFPLVALIVSGGHTMLVEMVDHGRYRLLGRTIDDAAGEAFDKVARFLGLGYPGGPAIDDGGAAGNPEAIRFPRAMLNDGLDVSFSGLKTAVVNHVRKHPDDSAEDIAASFQAAVVDVLVAKTRRAADAVGRRRWCSAVAWRPTPCCAPVSPRSPRPTAVGRWSQPGDVHRQRSDDRRHRLVPAAQRRSDPARRRRPPRPAPGLRALTTSLRRHQVAPGPGGNLVEARQGPDSGSRVASNWTWVACAGSVPLLRMLRIGPLEPVAPVVLAPMAGVTNAPFRAMCRQLRARADLRQRDGDGARRWCTATPRRERMMTFAAGESPAQPAAVRQRSGDRSARRCAGCATTDRVDHIDLNFGCPAAKVTRKGGGAAVPVKPRLLRAILRAAVGAASPYGVPVTAKFRTGLTRRPADLPARPVASPSEEGVAAIALHARTAEQHYAGAADWAAIGELKAAVTEIPVLGNGDIWEAADALAMMRATGCDGVVIGRGCLGRPWLFARSRRRARRSAPCADADAR